MTLILLAISLTIVACVIAYNLAIYALPVMAAITAAQYAWGAGAGVLIAIGAALLSIALVIGVLGFAKNPVLRLIALALFAVPAVIAGYALVYGITKNVIDSGVALNLLGGIGGLAIGVSAITNLNALGESVLSR